MRRGSPASAGGSGKALLEGLKRCQLDCHLAKNIPEREKLACKGHRWKCRYRLARKPEGHVQRCCQEGQKGCGDVIQRDIVKRSESWRPYPVGRYEPCSRRGFNSRMVAISVSYKQQRMTRGEVRRLRQEKVDSVEGQ